MRLTGATNETLALDLFVLGSRRAETDGLEVVCCDVSAVGEMRAYGMDGHAELSRRAGESRVLTRLTGTLSGDAMQRDVVVLWRDVATVRPTYRTAAVALTESGAAAGVTCIGALFIATLLRGLRRVRGSDWTADAVRFDLCASGIGAAAAFVVAWLTIPTLPGGAHPIERDAYRDWPFHHDRMPSEPLRDVAAARAWAASAAAGHLNPYTDDPIREEDSPGNYVVREREGRVELATYVGMRNDVWEQVMDLSAPPR
jgi:hypothetical protein